MLCPVCSLMFTESPASQAVSFHGKAYHVCGSECARKLRSNPPRYGVPSRPPKVAKGRRR